MSRNSVVPKIGGFVPPLPDTAAKELQLRFPTLPIKAVEAAFQNYFLFRDAMIKQEEASVIRKRYHKLQRLVKETLAEAEWLNQTNLATYVEQIAFAALADPGYRALPTAINSLQILDAALPHARKYLPDGHQMTAGHRLCWHILSVLSACELPVNGKPGGPLCYVTGVLLEAANERPSSIVAIVKPVVREFLKKKAAKGA